MHKFIFNSYRNMNFAQADEGTGGGAAAEEPAGQSMGEDDGDDDFGNDIPEDFGVGADLDVEVLKPVTPAADGQVAQTPVAAPAAQPQTPVVPAAPQAAPVAAPAQAAPAAQPAPAVVPGAAQPEPAQPAAVPGAEAQAPMSMEQIRQNYQTARTQAIAGLAEHHFKLTDVELQELEEAPGVAVPKLLARAYMDATTASVAHMVQVLPEMVSAVLEGQKAATAAEDSFFSQWPALKTHESGMQTVQQLGQAYRSMYPHASKEDFIKMVGAQAMLALGLQGAMGTPGAQPQQPQVQQPQRRPFQPAGARGSSAPIVPPAAQGNVFAALAEDDLMQDAADEM